MNEKRRTSRWAEMNEVIFRLAVFKRCGSISLSQLFLYNYTNNITINNCHKFPEGLIRRIALSFFIPVCSQSNCSKKIRHIGRRRTLNYEPWARDVPRFAPHVRFTAVLRSSAALFAAAIFIALFMYQHAWTLGSPPFLYFLLMFTTHISGPRVFKRATSFQTLLMTKCVIQNNAAKNNRHKSELPLQSKSANVVSLDRWDLALILPAAIGLLTRDITNLFSVNTDNIEFILKM